MASLNVQAQLANELVSRLEALAEDRAALARLKRCAGRPLSECQRAYSLFYGLLPSAALGKPWLEETCFLIATLFALAPSKGGMGLGQALRLAADKSRNDASGIQRRLDALLDADVEDLSFRLRQTVRLLAPKEIAIDWRQLLLDLLHWEAPSRHVQKEWARRFYRADEAAAG